MLPSLKTRRDVFVDVHDDARASVQDQYAVHRHSRYLPGVDLIHRQYLEEHWPLRVELSALFTHDVALLVDPYITRTD